MSSKPRLARLIILHSTLFVIISIVTEIAYAVFFTFGRDKSFGLGKQMADFNSLAFKSCWKQEYFFYNIRTSQFDIPVYTSWGTFVMQPRCQNLLEAFAKCLRLPQSRLHRLIFHRLMTIEPLKRKTRHLYTHGNSITCTL